jgi:hypothetical protein
VGTEFNRGITGGRGVEHLEDPGEGDAERGNEGRRDIDKVVWYPQPRPSFAVTRSTGRKQDIYKSVTLL